MFVALGGLVQGFLKGCRPFFGIDGAFLKGPFKGVLLAATSLDGNKGVFPLAWCVAEGESSDSWSWFLDCLQSCIGDSNAGVPYTIVSKKNAKELAPEGEARNKRGRPKAKIAPKNKKKKKQQPQVNVFDCNLHLP